ncbi:Putative F0F1-ATPase subunit (ATPase_gene1) [Gimesia panareensis]|uniref:F0F1-ATPase subunit (ATPase_gene1) n=1 Tax=Gimesia panareensis TaxID=2527978 RepID=A0A518FIE0_9PLAN|nr:AtpZ/AtpI family protein [Gimesia panareensis]QDV16114.1 Putative F0F1-ATPase subunit (ATPase_gene1) [Gimesia panareensis]
MPQPDRRTHSTLVEAHQWVSRLITVSLEMALPAFLGHWLDEKWNTSPWLTAVGALLGFACGMAHLLQMAKEAERKERKKRDQSTDQRNSNHGNDHQSATDSQPEN